MPSIRFQGSTDDAIAKVKQTITNLYSRARLVDEQHGYLRYEFTSLIFRFVDDVEFLVDDSAKQIEFRSASRIGHSDMGVNRRRMSRISEEISR